MFPKRNRLSRLEFAQISRTGRTFPHSLFSVLVSPAKSFKASVVVSKKVEPLASKRNLLRRRYYGALRELPALPPKTLVFYLRKESKGASSRNIQQALKEALAPALKN